MELWNNQPRHHHHHHREQVLPDPPFSAAPLPSPRGPRFGQEREASPIFERRVHPPSAHSTGRFSQLPGRVESREATPTPVFERRVPPSSAHSTGRFSQLPDRVESREATPTPVFERRVPPPSAHSTGRFSQLPDRVESREATPTPVFERRVPPPSAHSTGRFSQLPDRVEAREASSGFERRVPPPLAHSAGRFSQLPDRVEARETSPLFERRVPPPTGRSSGDRNQTQEAHDYQEGSFSGNRGKRRLCGGHSQDIVHSPVKQNQTQEAHDYQEGSFSGNRGKRRLSGGHGQDIVRSPAKQKPSVLSRIKSGKSVWERIEERPAFLSLPSPPGPPPICLNERPAEMGALDLSFNSNGSVAKVLTPTSPAAVGLNSIEKDPSPNVTLKKKVMKKKVQRNRTRVVVPIVSCTKGPGSVEGTPKRPLTSSPLQALGLVEDSAKPVISSCIGASDTNTPRSYPKRVSKMALSGKRPVKRSAKALTLKEDIVTQDVAKEGKVAPTDEEATKCLIAIATDLSSSQLCQQGSTSAMTFARLSAEEQSFRSENFLEGSNFEGTKKDECITHDLKTSQNSLNPIVSDTVNADITSPQISAGGTAALTTLLTNNVAGELPISVATVENGLSEDTSKQALQSTNTGNTTIFDFGFSTPSEGSLRSGIGNDVQVLLPVGSSTFCSSSNYFNCQSIKGKREGGQNQEQLDVAMVKKRNDILDGERNVFADPSLFSHVNGAKSVFFAETRDIDLNRTLSDGVFHDDDNDRSFSLSVKDHHTELDCRRVGHDLLHLPVGSLADERVELACPSRHSEVHSSVVLSKVQEEKPISKGDPMLPPKILSEPRAEDDKSSDKGTTSHRPVPGKALALSTRQPKRGVAGDLKIAGEEPMNKKTSLSYAVPRVIPNRLSLSSPIKEPARSSRTLRNKTWHRGNGPLNSASHGNIQAGGGTSTHRQSPRKLSRPQNSYIRKGNSLIRKPLTELRPPQQSHGSEASTRIIGNVTRRNTESEAIVDRAGITDQTTGSIPSFERPKTPPLPLGDKLPNCAVNPVRDLSIPMPGDLVSEADIGVQSRQLEGQTVDLPSGSGENKNNISSEKIDSSKMKQMVYVKRKSNQLVAAPGPESGDPSMHPTERSQTLSPLTSTDLYYRLKKNQLVRNASSDNQQKQDKILSVDNLTSDEQRILSGSTLKRSTTSLFKRRLDKVLQKTYKHPKSSLVWTLSGEKSHNRSVVSLNRWKVLPHIFPWKRAIYSKNSVSAANILSLSPISRKLQITRQRNTIYKVSTDGFSLRKAKVLSIGRSSLKWSKSIDKHSKKASEEATRAVVEVQKKRKEIKKSKFLGAKRNGNYIPRERIFRVGSARYKMDSSKRTLIRIPDEQSCSVDKKSGNKSQISFVPRRLLIGNDEYIRIGNGNQLVRDPKKLVRILANEKVRWSLHTARLRLARKQQYCQFFTRFGKCNKKGGKCPYIHDPTKVAICTKFLRDLCSDNNCKLTHKVLPERMPDCSYFLQGLCTNVNCPYRHVNVNPKASVCEGFLRGYCGDGDECRKKHSYVCPQYEATGKCQQGSKCKLHHPKRKTKSKKRKQPAIQSNSSGRYFGNHVTEVVETFKVSSDKHDAKRTGDVFDCDGQLADFIGVDIGTSDDHGLETNVPMDSHPTQRDSSPSDMQPDNLDMLIKPFRIMNKASSLTQ